MSGAKHNTYFFIERVVSWLTQVTSCPKDVSKEPLEDHAIIVHTRCPENWLVPGVAARTFRSVQIGLRIFNKEEEALHSTRWKADTRPAKPLRGPESARTKWSRLRTSRAQPPVVFEMIDITLVVECPDVFVSQTENQKVGLATSSRIKTKQKKKSSRHRQIVGIDFTLVSDGGYIGIVFHKR